MNTQKQKVISPPSFESKIARDREYFLELIAMLKALKPKGWRKEVRHAQEMIKAIDQAEDRNRLDKLRNTCKAIARRYRKEQKKSDIKVIK